MCLKVYCKLVFFEIPNYFQKILKVIKYKQVRYSFVFNISSVHLPRIAMRGDIIYWGCWGSNSLNLNNNFHIDIGGSRGVLCTAFTKKIRNSAIAADLKKLRNSGLNYEAAFCDQISWIIVVKKIRSMWKLLRLLLQKYFANVFC